MTQEISIRSTDQSVLEEIEWQWLLDLYCEILFLHLAGYSHEALITENALISSIQTEFLHGIEAQKRQELEDLIQALFLRAGNTINFFLQEENAQKAEIKNQNDFVRSVRTVLSGESEYHRLIPQHKNRTQLARPA